MAPSVVNTWTGAFSVTAGFAHVLPVGQSTQVNVGNTAGNWLVAVAAWQSPGEHVTTMAFGDDAANHWIPLGAPAGTSSAAGAVRSAIWAAPCAAAATRVWASPTGFSPGYAVLVCEVAGMAPGYSLQAIDTAWANAGTTAALSLPAPAVPVIMLTCCGTDNNTASLSLSSAASWTALPTVTTSDGADHLADMTLKSAWLSTSSATSGTWTVTGSTPDLGACAVALAVNQAAPAGPSQGWPHEKFEVAFGAGIQTPWDQLTWTDLTARYRGISGQRGKQYELDSVQASEVPLVLSNNDGALTPGNAASPYSLGISGWTARNGATLALSRDYAWTGPASMLMAPDGVTATTAAESAQVAVTASTAGYSGSAAVYSPQGWVAVAVAIRWYTSGGTLISTSTGTSAAVTAGQWAYPQAAASSPSTAAFATLFLQVTGTAPSTMLTWWDACQLTSPAGAVINGNTDFPVGPDVYVPARKLSTWQGRAYVNWRGFIERWPSQMSASRYTSASATGTDIFAGLTSLQPTAVAGEILLDDPWGYWPCSDPEGSAMAANLAPTSTGGLNVVESKFGAGPSGAQAFGGDTSGLTGAPSGCWTQSGLNSGSTDITHGFCLQSPPTSASPPIGAGITIECWANFGTGTTVHPNGKLLIWALQGTAGTIAELWANYDGSGSGVGFYLSLTDKGTRAVTSNRVWPFPIESVITGPTAPGPGWHLFAVSLTQTAWQMVLDGGDQPLTPASGTCNLAPAFQWISFGGAADRVLTGQSSNLSLEGLAVYPSVLPQTRIVAHYFGVQNGLAGDNSRERISRLLSYAGPLPPSRIGTGTDIIQGATDIAGQACSQNITNIAQSDTGLLYVDRAGYLAFDNRAARWNRAIAWDVGEQASAILNSTWDFESGIFPWVAHASSGVAGVTVSASSAVAWTGTQSLLVTTSGSAVAPGAACEHCAVPAGSAVTGSAMAYSAAGWSTGAFASANFYSSSGGLISSAAGTTVPLAAGTWAQVTATGTAPAGTVTTVLVVSLSGTPGSGVTASIDQAVLGLAGEVPYGAGFGSDFDPSQVFDDLTITQYGGTTVTLSSPTGIAQYGDETLQETVYLTDPDLVADLTNWILAMYGLPGTRIAQFTVDAKANPAAWPFVLSADVGTVVQVSRRLQGTQAVIQAPFVIQSVSPSNAPGQWQATYAATPSYLGALATNDPVRGLPNGLNPIAF